MNKDKETSKDLKAGAFVCPTCFVEYIEVKEDFEHENDIIRSVRMLRCPICNEEIFNPDQQEQILKKLRSKK